MVVLSCLVVAFAFQDAPPPSAVPAPAPVRPDRMDRPLRIVELTGTPFERGVTHGKALQKEIHELAARWKRDLEQSYGMKPDDFITRFLAQTSFEDAMEEWTPDLLEEIRGIAEGAGIPRAEIYAYQLIDEVWANAREVTGKRCTSIGVSAAGGRPTWVAQNLDLETWGAGYATVLHLRGSEQGQEAFVLTLPGVVGLNGVNRHGVAITCNTLLDLTHAGRGLPVACIVRGVLAQESLEGAVSFLREVPHASGQNYIVGGRERAVSLECSASQVAEFVPWEGAGLTFHTNHARANDDRDPLRGGRGPATRCERFLAVEKRLRNRETPIDLDVLVEALSSRDSERNPVSNPGTFACTIMELTDPPVLHLAPGRPHETQFRTLRFTGDASVTRPAGKASGSR